MGSPANTASKEKVIIGFENEVNPSLVQAQGGDITDQFEFIDAVAAEVPEDAMTGLENNPQVEYVEIDHEVRALGETLPWGIDRIDAEVVWGGSEDSKEVTESTSGSGYQVAVVDTGIDYTHPDLDGNYLDGYDFANDDDDPKDDNGHGTHVSGTIAAEENTEGVIGASPEVGLYALKSLDKRGRGYVSDVVAGIEWAVKGPDGAEGTEDDAEVVSMSLGSDSGSSALKDAVDAAYRNGTLPVAAAGNDGDGDCSTDEYSYPAAYSSVIAVGATDKDDSIAGFSNSGPYLELAAPGVDILSTMPTYRVYLNGPYHKSQDYDTLSGTSMATPHVSGTAALVYSAGATDTDGDGNIADDVRGILNSTAEDLGADGRDNCYGYGLVNATRAVAAVEPEEKHDLAVTKIDSPDGVVQGGNASINVTVENQGTFNETSNLTLVDGYDGETIGSRDVDLSSGSSKTYTFNWNTTGENATDHELNATVQPVSNETETADNFKTTVVTVREPKHDLAVTSLEAPMSVTVNSTADINVTVENQGTYDENSTLTLVDEYDSEEIGNASVDLSAGSSNTYTFNWNTSGEATGNHTLNATVAPVTDETETSDNSKTAVVEVKESAAPIIDRFNISEVDSPNPHAEFEIDWAVSDDGGDLDTVKITMEDGSGNLVDSETVDVSGSTASDTTKLKDRHADGSGETYVFELTVTDKEGNIETATKQKTES